MGRLFDVLAFAGSCLAIPAQAQTEPSEDLPIASARRPIVVTATKRERDLQDSSPAISIVTRDVLEWAGVRDIGGLSGIVPSFRAATFANTINTNFIVRGFGNGAFGPGVEPSVGVFVDGIYRSRAGAAIADLPQVDRIEVLKGPQSTLFGKNASAGVISIVTTPPQHAFTAGGELTAGNRNMLALSGYVTGPVTESLALSLEGGRRVSDGYGSIPNLDRTINDRDRWWLRGQALLEPAPSLRMRLIADYERIDEQCCLVTNVLDGPAGAVIRALGGGYVANDPFSYAMPANLASPNRIKNYGVSLQSDFDLEGSSITAITAYRRGDHVQDHDADFTSADLLSRYAQDRSTRTFTQELRWTSDAGRALRFMLGGFYMHEAVDQTGELALGSQFRVYAGEMVRAQTGGMLDAARLEVLSRRAPGMFWQAGQGTDEAYRLRNDSGTLYANADFDLDERLTLSAGLAYIADRKRGRAKVVSTDTFSAVDLVEVGRNALVSSLVGAQLGLPRAATAQEVADFSAARPTPFQTIQMLAAANAGLSPREAQGDGNPLTTAGNSLLMLRQLQFLPPFLDFPNAVESGITRDNKLTWSLKLNFRATPDLNAYVNYSTGFKASSINLSRDSRPSRADFIPGSPAQFPSPQGSPIRDAGLALPNLTSGTRFTAPESVRLFEAGLRYHGRLATATLTVFHQRIDDFQTTIFIGNAFVLGNAGRQSTRGVELEASVAPAAWLRIDTALAYLDARYDDYRDAQVVDGLSVDYSGRKVAGVSPVTGTVAATAEWPVSDAGSVVLNAMFTYESPVAIRNDLAAIKREVSNLRGSLRWHSRRGFDISIWGQNLLNSRWLVQTFPGVLQPGTISAYPNEPRSYGITLRFKT